MDLLTALLILDGFLLGRVLALAALLWWDGREDRRQRRLCESLYREAFAPRTASERHV